jgi:NarL family two-component system sensor histidine kinase LiaS
MQEALTNAIRHSGCSRILIDIESSERLLIRIVDNGTGFNPDSKGEGTFGIGNMRSRAREAGFGFELITSDSGTEVAIVVDRASGDRPSGFLHSKQGG